VNSGQLPPLANVFVVRSPDPSYVAHVAEAIRKNGIQLVHPAPDLAVGLVNLPGRPSATFQQPSR
jgi:uncharacterized protein (DUF1800 family)